MQSGIRLNRRLLRPVLYIALLYFTFLGGNFITDHSLGPRMFHHALMVVLLAGVCNWKLIPALRSSKRLHP